MARNRSLYTFFILASVIVSIALLPSCRRAPDTPAEGTKEVEIGGESGLSALELPLQNPVLGISLSSTPPGLIATFNENASIEVTDPRRPDLRLSFFADLPGVPLRSPVDIEGFEEFIGKHDGGSLTDRGEIETALGPATWASGTYSAEDQVFGDVRVFAPHPSGNGTLILASVSPAGDVTVEEQLAMMKEVLTHVL